MPLGNRAEDFGVALRAIDDQVDLPDQVTYDAFRTGLGEAWLRQPAAQQSSREQCHRGEGHARSHSVFSWF